MAIGWRRRGQTAEATAAPTSTPASGRPLVLNAAPDLCRPAAWEGLLEPQRAALLAPYASALDGLPTRPETSASTDALAQTWVADYAAVWLQRNAVGVIQTWLADAAPDAHLIVTGQRGYGRLSVVTTLARRAMALATRAAGLLLPAKPRRPDPLYSADAATAHGGSVRLPGRGRAPAGAERLGQAARRACGAW